MEIWTDWSKVEEALQKYPTPSTPKRGVPTPWETHSEYEPLCRSIGTALAHPKFRGGRVRDTLLYCWKFFMKCIFVQIRGGKVVTLVGLENPNFHNTWNALVQRRLTVQSCRKRPWGPARQWTATNCFVNPWVWHGKVGDKHYDVEIRDQLESLCETYVVPDVDLILNKKDSQLLRWDDHYPYVVQGTGVDPAQKGKTFYPIFSFSTTPNHADIMIPTSDDWNLVLPKPQPWDSREPRVVWRGGDTGCGWNIHNNPRLKAVSLRFPWLDAGITKISCRIRVGPEGKLFQLPPLRTVPFMSREEQQKFKYVLHIDGNVAAYRLSTDLASGSVVLKVAGPYEVWFSPLLRPGVHYLPVKADLSDLEEVYGWCIAHDAECKAMTQRAYTFVKDVVSKPRMLQYWRFLITQLRA